MAAARRTPYVSTNLTVPARDCLQRATLNHSAREGRRLSMSAVLLSAMAVAEAHPDEWAAALRGPVTEEGTDAS